METVILIGAAGILAIVVLMAADLFFGIRSMTNLHDVAPARELRLPRISVIMPACNEERHIEQAVKTQLCQDYPNLEILVVDDRSTDATTDILAELQKKYTNLKVIRIDTLPPGWMGKAHALQRGAEAAGGEYLLFTDGDVFMEESTISRAATHMKAQRLDHISLIFRNISSGWLLNALILDSGIGLLQVFRPWRARRNDTRAFVGVGAFNLVKQEVYHALGGHRSIRMHPVDDLMLGKIIKRASYRQECLLGMDLVTLPWYAGVAQMVDGLMKNAMAFINFRYSLLPPLLAGLILLNILPVWGILFADTIPQLLFSAVIATKTAVSAYGTRKLGVSPWCAPATLLTPYISIYIILRAAWSNHRDGGIYWRGTFYPLQELQKNETVLPWL